MSLVTALLFVIGVSVIGILLIAVLYNQLVTLRNRWENAYAQIDVQLKRRYDLIPNLVESVKGYFQHERSTLEAVIAARNAAAAANRVAAGRPQDGSAIAAIVAAESVLHGQLGRFVGLTESYPDLKADQTVLRLMEDLSSTENRVAFARQAFNDAVMQYNTARQTFPAAVLAAPLGFQPAELFKIDNEVEREPVGVKLQA